MHKVADVRTVVLRSIWLKVSDIRKYLWLPNIYPEPRQNESQKWHRLLTGTYEGTPRIPCGCTMAACLRSQNSL